jgi:hypothetical protein
MPTRGNITCLTLITAAIHAMLSMKQPTIQRALDALVGEQ